MEGDGDVVKVHALKDEVVGAAGQQENAVALVGHSGHVVGARAVDLDVHGIAQAITSAMVTGAPSVPPLDSCRAPVVS